MDEVEELKVEDPKVCVVNGYKLIHVLGRGAFGVVYKGSKNDHEVFAVKELNLTHNMEYVRREIDIVGSDLKHENIVRIVDKFKDYKKGCAYIVMELCEEGDLSHFIKLNQPKVPERLLYMVDLAKGLCFLHLNSIVHRDIKADNVLFKHNGQRSVGKITDFGLSRVKEYQKQQFHSICGTPAYQAPEILLGNKYTSLVDVYSLGLLYYALVNNVTFKENEFSVIHPLVTKTDGSRETLNDVLRANFPSQKEFISSYFQDKVEVGMLVYGMVQLKPDDRTGMESVLVQVTEARCHYSKDGMGYSKTEQDNNVNQETNERMKAELEQVKQKCSELQRENEDLKCKMFPEQGLHMQANGSFKICKKNEEDPRKVKLSAKSFNAMINQSKPEDVQSVSIALISIQECCTELFRHLENCGNCSKLYIDRLSDGSQFESSLVRNLSKCLEKLRNLQDIDIRGTYMSSGWARVMNSIQGDCLRLLSLYHNKLQGQGRSLGVLLRRLVQLRWLDLRDSGLRGTELIQALQGLPQNCPHVKGLRVDEHDLRGLGTPLVSLVKGLKELKLLGIQHCKLDTQTLTNISCTINKGIEIIHASSNEKISDPERFYAPLSECRSLKIIILSANQLISHDTDLFKATLNSIGCTLMIESTASDSEWETYEDLVIQLHKSCFES